MEEVNIIASVRELNRAVPWAVQSLQRVESAQARVAVEVTRHHVILSCGLSFIIISSSRFVPRRPTPPPSSWDPGDQPKENKPKTGRSGGKDDLVSSRRPPAPAPLR